MKMLLGGVAVLLLMGAIVPVMAHSAAYNDGYRQGIDDYVHSRVGPLVDNPTGNPNIIEFVNGRVDAWNDIFSGPLSFDLYFSKKAMYYTDGWVDGANALVHGFGSKTLGHHSASYIQGFYSGYNPQRIQNENINRHMALN